MGTPPKKDNLKPTPVPGESPRGAPTESDRSQDRDEDASAEAAAAAAAASNVAPAPVGTEATRETQTSNSSETIPRVLKLRKNRLNHLFPPPTPARSAKLGDLLTASLGVKSYQDAHPPEYTLRSI